ncbi:6-phosphofructokinase [Gordonia sp. NPDC003424]
MDLVAAAGESHVPRWRCPAAVRGGTRLIAPAPGMNTAVRAAVRQGLPRGYSALAVRNGFRGLRRGQVQEMGWTDVSGWLNRPVCPQYLALHFRYPDPTSGGISIVVPLSAGARGPSSDTECRL